MIKVTEQDDRIILNTIYGGIALTKAQGKALAAQLRKVCATATKYGNKKVIAHGIEFDSKVEADFYEHLLQLHKSDEIIIQPKFVLQDKQAGLREISYIADFQVGALVFDVKGMVLPIFSVKKKMFKARYPDLCLSLVNKCPLKYQSIYGRWIDITVLNKLRSAAKRAIKKAKDEIK
jgi:hypothetical protein